MNITLIIVSIINTAPLKLENLKLDNKIENNLDKFSIKKTESSPFIEPILNTEVKESVEI